MGGKAKAAKAPDFTEYTKAFKADSEKMWNAFDKQFEWAKAQDERNNHILDQVLGIQLPAMQQMATAAAEDRKRYKDVFVPAEDRYLAEVQNYGSKEDQLRRAGTAQADTAAAFEAQRRSALDNLRSFGIQPGVAYAGLDAKVRAQQAAAQALVANKAMSDAEMQGIGLRRDALNLGTNLQSRSIEGFTNAGNLGAATMGGVNQTTSTGASALMSGKDFAQMGMDATGKAMGAQQQQFENQHMLDKEAADANAAQAQGIGSMIGTVAGGMMGGPMGASLGSSLGGMAGGAVAGKAGGGRVGDGPFPAIPLPGDTVPAMLNKDEYVIPKDIVMRKGTEFFDRLLEKTRNPAPSKKQALPA